MYVLKIVDKKTILFYSIPLMTRPSLNSEYPTQPTVKCTVNRYKVIHIQADHKTKLTNYLSTLGWSD